MRFEQPGLDYHVYADTHLTINEIGLKWLWRKNTGIQLRLGKTIHKIVSEKEIFPRIGCQLLSHNPVGKGKSATNEPGTYELSADSSYFRERLSTCTRIDIPHNQRYSWSIGLP